MFRRSSKIKEIIACFLIMALVFQGLSAYASYLCPTTLETFDTIEECQNLCVVDCIVPETYMCSADTDGDGETELYQCQQVYQCPLGEGIPCDENNQCSLSGTCTENQTYTVCSVTRTYLGESRTYTTPPNTSIVVPELDVWCGDITVWFDNSCNIIKHDSCGSNSIFSVFIPPGSSFEASCCGNDVITNTSSYSVVYTCSSNGQTYSNLSSCQSACVQTAACTSSWQCPIAGGSDCEDVSVSENYETDSPDLSYYRDDGAVDPNTGQCLGQIYLFNGRPMTCRTVGLQTAFHNCCDADDELVAEMNNELLLLGGVLVGVEPSTLLIGAIVSLGLSLLDLGCEEDDVLTATLNEMGLCHYIGDKCVAKLPIIGCVQRANVYCCFNSKLARIIHEQGRAQLSTLNNWGTVDEPNCRGFTPEEFQMLDFGKIDLSEYYGDIQTKSITEIQNSVNQNVNEFQSELR